MFGGEIMDIDIHVFFDKKLSLNAKGLYAMLAEYAGYDPVSMDEIENFTRDDTHTVYKAIKELEKEGYIEEKWGLVAVNHHDE
jgi:DNA-binding PadR family transcriptional regulator